MSHYVKCAKCGLRFDRDKVPFVTVSPRRYAHVDCEPYLELEKEKQSTAEDYQKMEAYIKDLFKMEELSPRILMQIKDFQKKYGYTYKGIHKALVYFFSVKQNSIEKANNGIGIVPYIYDNAQEYYKALWATKQVNEAKPIVQYVAPPEKTIIIPIPEPVKRLRRTSFDFMDE